MRHSGAANSYRHEYLTVRPNTLGVKVRQENGPEVKEEKPDQGQGVAQEGAVAEDIFGDCDSDDEDPTVTSLLESRSLPICSESAVPSDNAVVGSGEEIPPGESVRSTAKRARDDD